MNQPAAMSSSGDCSKHIFDHCECIYVVDFASKLCWVISPEDKDEPISALDIQRNTDGWGYKASGLTVDAPFLSNLDDEWSMKMNCRYEDYISNLIISSGESA